MFHIGQKVVNIVFIHDGQIPVGTEQTITSIYVCCCTAIETTELVKKNPNTKGSECTFCKRIAYGVFKLTKFFVPLEEWKESEKMVEELLQSDLVTI